MPDFILPWRRSSGAARWFDPEQLIEHLRIVGYNQVDVVEMPGEFAHRGGLLDVYPPELDRPVRIEFFGDEVESIRKFDPSTQRSAASTEEVVLLPLTETPVDEETLAGINARLSRRAAGRRRRKPSRRRCARPALPCFQDGSYTRPSSALEDSLFDLATRCSCPARRTGRARRSARCLVDKSSRGARTQPCRQSRPSRISLPHA